MGGDGQIADGLAQAYTAHFVGRGDELRELVDAARAPGFRMVHVYAPGGVGKTTLLRALRARAAELELAVVAIDGRMTDGSADGFEAALRRELGIDAQADLAAHLASRRHVLVIDTFEQLRPLEVWLRESFMPRLGRQTALITAGRERLSEAWRTDLRWADALSSIPLRNLSADESRAMLTARGVDPEQHERIVAFTHGHALALALVCESLTLRPGAEFWPDSATDVVHALVEHFAGDIQDPDRRRALEVASVVRVTTEPVLRRLLGIADAYALFDWLRGLSFMEQGSLGLMPHEVVRNAIVADVRWRDPEWFATLRGRAHLYYWQARDKADPGDDRTHVALLYDLSFLHNANPIARQFFEWRSDEPFFAGRPSARDKVDMMALVAEHEGTESADHAWFWHQRQPQHSQVFRDRRMNLAGYHGWVRLTAEGAPLVEGDPATAAAWRAMAARGPLRGNECALLTRHWVPRDGYQQVSALASQMFLHMVHRYFITRDLAFSFAYFAQPEFWTPVFTYMGFERAEDADYEVGGVSYGVFVHDWRSRPVAQWLDLLMSRETLTAPVPPDPAPKRSVVLDRTSFETAVKDALKRYGAADAFADNPLLDSRLVRERVDATTAPADCLRALIAGACATVDDKFRRAVERTYIQPADSQELAAESLNVPFSTYRRHLKRGIDAIGEYLWRVEIGEAETEQ